ncbi:MAG: hypothetical protein WCH98_21360, partial [Verrucomicrobiota bacterium]
TKCQNNQTFFLHDYMPDKFNFLDPASALRAEENEHGSRVPWLQRQRPGRAGVRCSRLTLLRRDRGFAATSFAFALIGDTPLRSLDSSGFFMQNPGSA